jgi:methylated-DNA-[protein]-cysteine S-methyltransferase
LEIYYTIIENKDTHAFGAKKVGVAGTVVKGKPRYVAVSLATNEKKFKAELKKIMKKSAAPRARHSLERKPSKKTKGIELKKTEAPIKPLSAEVRKYFKGDVKKFTNKPHFICGTPFQKKVWKALVKVPYGKTESYGGLAKKIGKPGAARAVGMANHANPVSLVVPCHRVVGSKGDLVGFGGGGVKVKKRLLELERA